MEKNGGLGVHVALWSVLAGEDEKPYGYGSETESAYVRFHADDDVAEQCISTIRQSPIRAVTYVGKVGIRTYGVHEGLGHPWRLMTLFRDPFDRLVSFYYYKIRRGVIPGPANASDFMEFAKEPVNRYYQCKMLSKLGAGECDGKDAYDEALANLEGFDWIGKIADMEKVLLSIWSTYGFQPFLSQHINRNPHKKDTFEHLRDDVYEINRYDMDLFDHVSDNPKNLFEVEPEKESQFNLASTYALATDSERDDAGLWEIKFGQTQDLLYFAQHIGGTVQKLYDMIQV